MQEHTSSGLRAPSFRIVVGVALDASGSRALRTAFRFAAGRADVEVHVVHALTESIGLYGTALEDAAATVASRRRLAMRLDESPAARIVHVRVGAAQDVIRTFAVEMSADLIVVGAGRSCHGGREVLGSVADAVTHDAACPVLVARTKDTGMTPEARGWRARWRNGAQPGAAIVHERTYP